MIQEALIGHGEGVNWPKGSWTVKTVMLFEAKGGQGGKGKAGVRMQKDYTEVQLPVKD